MTGGRRSRPAFADARRTAGYTQESLAEALQVDRTTVARWESGERTPVAYVRPRLARLLGCTVATLGELLRTSPPTVSATDAVGALPDHGLDDVLASADGVDDDVLDALAVQLDALRGVDRSVGAVAARDGVRSLVGQVEDLAFGVTGREKRRRLFRLLVELHTLAGWVAHDQGEDLTAWRQHNQARATASEAGSTAHAAHATAQQAVILAENGHLARAREHAARATGIGRDASPLIRAWLEASRGEVAAYMGERTATFRAFDRAAQWVDDGAEDGEPYVGLDAAHLERWRGQALVRLGEPEALTAVQAAIAVHDRAYKRAGASLRIDLAAGLARVDRAAARAELRRADSATAAVLSARLRRRVDGVRAML